MKITFDCPDKINGLLTMTIEPADYQEKVEKTLKDYRKKAQVPGFRPGQVPMGLVKRQYGTAVKVDEVNRLRTKSRCLVNHCLVISSNRRISRRRER